MKVYIMNTRQRSEISLNLLFNYKLILPKKNLSRKIMVTYIHIYKI